MQQTECQQELVQPDWTNFKSLLLKEGAFHLVERAPGVSVEEIKSKTEGSLIINGEVPEMSL